jgi:hypothetical protein
VGEILDGAITYVRRNPRATLGLAAGVALAGALVQVVGFAIVFDQLSGLDETLSNDEFSESDTTNLVGVNIVQGVQTLLTLFLQLVVTGMLTFVMGQSMLGRRVTAREAWDRVRPLIWRLLLVAVIASLAGVLAFVALLLPGIVLGITVDWVLGAILIALGVIAGIAVGVWIYTTLSLAPAALVLERVGVLTSLRRSRQLVAGSFWRIFGILLLSAVIVAVISGVVSVPFLILGALLGSFGDDADVALRADLFTTTLGGAVSSVITLPFAAGVTALLYIDRRMRREGLDVELARAAGIAPGAAPGPTGPVPGTPMPPMPGQGMPPYPPPPTPPQQQW